MISEEDKNATAAAALIALALAGGFLPAWAVLCLAAAIAAAAFALLGARAGFLALVPLAAIGSPWLYPAVSAASAALLLIGRGAGRAAGWRVFSSLSFASLAGLSYSYLVLPSGWPFSGLWAVLGALAAGLAGALGVMAPVGVFSPAAGAAGAALALYSLPELRIENLLYTESLLIGAGLSAALGLAAWAHGKIDGRGLAAGAALGTVIYTSAGTPGFLMLFFFVAGAVVATSHSAEKRGLPEDHTRRGAANVLANTGPAAGFALLSLFADDPLVFNIGFCGALSAALADTVSSELGTVYGPRPVDIVTRVQAKVGADGAVSLAGSLLGLAAAGFMALAAATAGLVPMAGAGAVMAGGVAGFMFDSYLGSAFENRGAMSADAVNAWGAFGGGAVAALMGLSLS
ncbi:MAG: DUF92 domain-containing protein [Candidatus Nitrospinota bacterium M3_3B_026]